MSSVTVVSSAKFTTIDPLAPVRLAKSWALALAAANTLALRLGLDKESTFFLEAAFLAGADFLTTLDFFFEAVL